MRLIKLIIVFFISIQLCHSQSEFSKKGIKRINITETYRQLLNDSTYHNSITETNETFYDIHGKKLRSIRTIYNNSIPKSKNETKFYYNNNNQIIYSNSYLERDSINIKTHYEYRNELLFKIHFNYIRNEKEYKFEELYYYDSNNKLISSNYFYYEKYLDAIKDDYSTYINLKEKYDKKERTIEMDWTKSDIKYKHNRFTYKWRKSKLLKLEKEFDKNDKLISITRFKYILDKKNNWIVKKEIKNKALNKITYREIEYY
ncbi:hypothetical protein H8K90_13420 [Winogradskyella echinorum]|uniref:YD repeat-containing protein n=1 Tax=Winogradskyella echinorum TaxID=538189 RepID=A0ABR6Y3R7_9FLAO|nr:hypothetical protein [Winogradskyella echinorum]MBC3847391.1 hypothetical protein [Winogradskyella echinorum]MBC5751739.1 hypothetical protein [Winogradskyella echinorum]